MVVTVCLQYFNAGFPDNAKKSNIKEALGFSQKTLDLTIRNLASKNLLANPSNITCGDDSVVLLNHKELIDQKILVMQNYKTLPLQ